jgi:hypothetical protein
MPSAASTLLGWTACCMTPAWLIASDTAQALSCRVATQPTAAAHQDKLNWLITGHFYYLCCCCCCCCTRAPVYTSTHLTRVDWNARNAPNTPANTARGVTPSYADKPPIASRPSGTLSEGSGTTVARLGGAALLLVVLFLLPNSCRSTEASVEAHMMVLKLRYC